MSEKALVILENDLGVKLDIEKDPLSLTAYDLEGNVISGGGGVSLLTCDIKIINNTGTLAGGIYSPTIVDGTINTQNTNIAPFADGTEVIVRGYVYDDYSLPILMMKMATPPVPATVAVSDAVNCTYDGTDPSNPYITVSGPDASITLTLS